MPTVPIEDAQNRLIELIGQLRAGEEMVITRDHQPVARLIGEPKRQEKPPRQLGTLKGTVRYLASDFDAPLKEFTE